MSEKTLSGIEILPEITEIEHTFPEICKETKEVNVTGIKEKENNNSLIDEKINEILNTNNTTETAEEQQCNENLINEKINEILYSVELTYFKEANSSLKKEDNKLTEPSTDTYDDPNVSNHENENITLETNEPANPIFSRDHGKEFYELKNEYLEAKEGLKYANNYIACLEYNNKQDKGVQERKIQQIIAGHENQISNLTVLFLEYLYRLKWNSERKIQDVLQKTKQLETKLNDSDAQYKKAQEDLKAVNTEKENLVKIIANKEKLIKNLKNKFAKAAKETNDLQKELDDAKNCFGLFLKKHNTELQAYDDHVLKTMMNYLLQMYQVRNKVFVEVADPKKTESKVEAKPNGKGTDKKSLPKKPTNTKAGKKGNTSNSNNRSGSVNNGAAKTGAAGVRGSNYNNNIVKLVSTPTVSPNPPIVVKTYTTKIVH